MPKDMRYSTSSSPPPLPPPLPDVDQEPGAYDDVNMGEGEDRKPAGLPAIPQDNQQMMAVLQQILAGQHHQTQAIKNLQKSVLTTRSMVNEIIMSHNELKEEIDSLKMNSVPGTSPIRAKLKEEDAATTALAETMPSTSEENDAKLRAGLTGLGITDKQVDQIIETWAETKQWPPHCALKKFAGDEDLVKVRFHRSIKHQHMPVKIPAREGTGKYLPRPCVLCSEGKARRKTSYMCSTCGVPLCIKAIKGEDPSNKSHHEKWHMIRNLIEEHRNCNRMLMEYKDSKKRSREDDDDDQEEEE